MHHYVYVRLFAAVVDFLSVSLHFAMRIDVRLWHSTFISPLPQTDRATRYVSQNLVDCRNRLYNKYTTNRSSGVRGLQLIDLLWTATTAGRLSYRCRQRIRPSTTTTTSFFYIAMLCIRGTSHGPVSVRLSVRLSVCPSQVGVSLKRLNAGSHKQHHTIAQGL